MGAIVLDPKGDRDLCRELRDGGAGRRQAVRRVDPAGPVRLQPLRARRGDGDRRQGARRRALHRAALPAPGAALPRSRGARAAQGRAWRSACGASSSSSTRRGWSCSRASLPERAGAGVCTTTWTRSRTRQQSDLAGVRDRLAIMAESDVGPWLDPRTRGRAAVDLLEAVRSAGGRVLQPGGRPPAAARADARGGDRAGPADDGRGAAGPAAADAGRDRRVLGDRPPSRSCGLFGRARSARASACARHPGARRSAPARTGAAARAGDGQPVRADRPPPGGARLGRADRRHDRDQGRVADLAPQRRRADPHARSASTRCGRRRSGACRAGLGGGDRAGRRRQREHRADVLGRALIADRSARRPAIGVPCPHAPRARALASPSRSWRGGSAGGVAVKTTKSIGAEKARTMMVRRDLTPSPERVAIMQWTARLGAVTAEALADRLDVSVASARAGCRPAQGGLAVARAARWPSSRRCTRRRAPGCAWPALQGLEPCRVSASNAQHLIACARVAAALERCYPDHACSGERELRRDERERGVRAGERPHLGIAPDGGPLLHRPDLVLWPQDAEQRRGLPVAVEVELTVKAPRRLAEICRAWARCRCVAGVLYLAPPEVRRALERAIDRVAGGRADRRARTRRCASMPCGSASIGAEAPDRVNRPKRGVAFAGGGSTIEERRPSDVQLHHQPRRPGRASDHAIPSCARCPRASSVCSLRIACNSSRRDADGEYREQAQLLRRERLRRARRRTSAATPTRAAASRSTAAWSGGSGRPPTSRSARR